MPLLIHLASLPEPGSLGILGITLIVLAILLRKKFSTAAQAPPNKEASAIKQS